MNVQGHDSLLRRIAIVVFVAAALATAVSSLLIQHYLLRGVIIAISTVVLAVPVLLIWNRRRK